MMSLLEMKKLVWDHYPDARSVFNTDRQQHKIYHKFGDCHVALSASFDDVRCAWEDAAKRLSQHKGVSDVTNVSEVQDGVPATVPGAEGLSDLQ